MQYYTWYSNSFQWKDLKESFCTKFSHFQGESQRMLSRLATLRICGQNSSSNSTTGEYENSQVWTWEERVLTPDVYLLSESRVYTLMRRCTRQTKYGDWETRVTNGSETSGDLSLRDACFGKPRSMNKRSFNPSNVYSRCKGSSGQGMKGGHTAAYKTTTRRVHFAAMMDIH